MFFKGVVEDNLDPLKIGRVKVRVIGKHSPTPTKNDSYEFLPTVDLPYASPIFPLGASSISGMCNFGVPDINSVVVCGYFDEDEQELFYIGTMGLVGASKLDGFGVQSNQNPKKSYPLSDLVSGTNTITSSSASNPLFSVPGSGYAATYPRNNVIETKSGHVIELDDTNGSERIRVYHKSGTYNETNPDGVNVDASVGDKYIVAPNVNIHCDTNCNIFTGGKVNVLSTGDTNLTSLANTNVTTSGHTTVTATGMVNVTGASVGINSVGGVGGASIPVKIRSYANMEIIGTTEIKVVCPIVNINP